ncbi:Hypothetical predicted protein [Olea europaea subsp. europaea]|uniref:Uncharacterized protein n=1 Tax=Olea europaea subsp. europaea TaxID=158383 RepID=A0A8S0QG07_OLEEU|nr:Hypothetical predicted protein [Olea europaea subsp. europaea]
MDEHTFNSIPPIIVTSEVEMKVLIEMNQKRVISICLTLMKKNIPESEHEYFDRRDRNVNEFWDTVEIVRDDVVAVPETVASHHDLTVIHRIYSVVQDNERDNDFTNENFIALSRLRHESSGSSQAGPSARSSNCSRIVLDDEDLYV